ncbi:MAG: hypothetical protein HRU18_03065 [Pseudoalteromonas sp.]|uniref:hypothetical protein n=1 Tax=Pseudoalteromonas sp. TaxID=53249 RepID=UPI001D33BF4E|nr:hypothetical protein [Pseudoalteromonas sp.]NRA77165.1 hypothetical protein [Pseudoalteromonas sp.]
MSDSKVVQINGLPDLLKLAATAGSPEEFAKLMGQLNGGDVAKTLEQAAGAVKQMQQVPGAPALDNILGKLEEARDVTLAATTEESCECPSCQGRSPTLADLTVGQQGEIASIDEEDWVEFSVVELTDLYIIVKFGDADAPVPIPRTDLDQVRIRPLAESIAKVTSANVVAALIEKAFAEGTAVSSVAIGEVIDTAIRNGALPDYQLAQ